MLKIWELLSADGSIQLTLKNLEKDRDRLITYDATPIKQNWEPFEVITLKKGTKQDYSQFVSGTPIFFRKTLDILDPLIHDYVEYLTVIHEEFETYLGNVTHLIDCVDKERSVAKYSIGKFYKYKKIYFIKDILSITPHTIFKVPEVKKFHVFVSDEFRDLVLNAKLKGFLFEEVWDSEVTDEMEEEQKQKYIDFLASIENSKGPKLSYGDAVRLTETGKAAAHKQWKLQADKDGSMLIGTLGDDCRYKWIDPLYIPPIFLEIEWHEVEKSSDI